MNIIGIIIGVCIVVGLIFAMGKMSQHGVDINDNFGCGDCVEKQSCNTCGTGSKPDAPDKEKQLKSSGSSLQ